MITGISANAATSAIGQQRPAAGRAEPVGARADAPTPSTAVVATELPREAPRFTRTHPDAAFVTHLIATVDGAPQTRRLRQTSAEDGTSRYTMTQSVVTPTKTTRRFSQVA